MAAIPSLAELAALQGDKSFHIKKPLSEGALAEVTLAMNLLHRAGRRIDAAQGAMQNCRVPFDAAPFRRLQDCLNDAFCAISHIPLEHADAVAAAKKKRP